MNQPRPIVTDDEPDLAGFVQVVPWEPNVSKRSFVYANSQEGDIGLVIGEFWDDLFTPPKPGQKRMISFRGHKRNARFNFVE
jgi:hypothetical protein